MDQDGIKTGCLGGVQSGPDRGGAGRATGDGGQGLAEFLFDGGEVVALVRIDPHDDTHDPVMMKQGMNTTMKHTGTGQCAILFRHAATGPFAAPGGHDHSSDLHQQASSIAAAQQDR